jgi:hypothetical protein
MKKVMPNHGGGDDGGGDDGDDGDDDDGGGGGEPSKEMTERAADIVILDQNIDMADDVSRFNYIVII